MNPRTYATFALLSFAALATAGCSPIGTCGPASCTGCCDAAGVCQAGNGQAQCGTGGNTCQNCGAGNTCSPQKVCLPNKPVCVPKTCAQLGKNCGQVDDGCGGTLTCGTCSGAGENCGGGGVPNVCGVGTCTPKSCAEQSFECGRPSDGCAAILECGGCAAPMACGGGGTPYVCGGCEVTTSCAAQGKNCGSIPDGCGGSIECGSCAAGQSCGAAGIANLCGSGSCTPKTCASLGKNCGSVSDGCSATLNCGTCSAGTCGGGGTANVCGATCSISCPAGFTCNGLGQCAGGSLAGLVLNEVGHAVSGTIRINGLVPTYDAAYCASRPGYEIAEVVFTEKAKGYSATASIYCGTTNFAWSTVLPPGTWEVRVNRGSYGGSAQVNLLPVNYQAIAALEVNGPLANQVLDEVGHPVSGTLRVNGAAPTYDAAYCSSRPGYEIAQVDFREKAKGYSATASIYCGTTNFAWSTVLPPGTWEVRVNKGSYGGSAQVNLLPVNYLANPNLVVSAPMSNQVLDEVGHAVSGTIRVNGAVPTYDAAYCASRPGYEIAEVAFTEKTKGYSAAASIYCGTTNFAWSTVLPPGTWEVRVNKGSYGGSAQVNLLPVNYLANPNLVVSAPLANQLLDEVGHAVSGTIRINGAVPTYDAAYCASRPGYEIAEVAFTEKTKGYSAAASIYCGTTNFAWSTVLPPGTWEVRVNKGSYGGSAQVNLLPVNYQAILALDVTGPLANQVLNEVGHPVSGTIRINGATPTYDAAYCSSRPGYEIAEVAFTEKTKGYSAAASIYCGTTNFAWSTVLPPGTWEVRVNKGSYGGSAQVNLLPVNYQAVAALEVAGPLANQVLDEVGRSLSGVVRVNGAIPTYDAAYCSSRPGYEIGEVTFAERSKGYSAAASIYCGTTDFAWSAVLPPGAWDIRVNRGSYGGSAQVSLLPVNYFAVERLLIQ